eukprot:g1682.t1
MMVRSRKKSQSLSSKLTKALTTPKRKISRRVAAKKKLKDILSADPLTLSGTSWTAWLEHKCEPYMEAKKLLVAQYTDSEGILDDLAPKAEPGYKREVHHLRSAFRERKKQGTDLQQPLQAAHQNSAALKAQFHEEMAADIAVVKENCTLGMKKNKQKAFDQANYDKQINLMYKSWTEVDVVKRGNVVME